MALVDDLAAFHYGTEFDLRDQSVSPCSMYFRHCETPQVSLKDGPPLSPSDGIHTSLSLSIIAYPHPEVLVQITSSGAGSGDLSIQVESGSEGAH